MKINIFTNEDWFDFDLTKHGVEVDGGALWVYRVNEFNARTDTVAVFAKGEWKRVEFDRV